MSDHRTPEYHKAISGQRWRELKERVIVLRGKSCEGCGTKRGRLDLHHDTYDRLGQELPTDVRLLCRDCHRAEDILREERGEVRKAEALRNQAVRRYESRIDGFMRSRYGSDWTIEFSWMDAREMFEECEFD